MSMLQDSVPGHADSPNLTIEAMRLMNTPVVGPVHELPSVAQVMIVGAGPVGMLAANLLGKLSIDVILIDKSPETSAMPKAIVMDDESARAHHYLGLGEVTDGSARPFGIHFMAASGRAIVRANGFVTPNGHGNRNAISQPVCEKILLGGLERFKNVSVGYRTELVNFDQSEVGVTATVQGPSGVARQIQIQYLLGCDGANSFVRRSLGLDFSGRRINQPHLVVDLADFPDDSPFSRFFCDPERPFNSVPGPYGGRRIEFMLNPGDDPNEIVSHETVRRLVDRHTPYKGVQLHILRTAVYGFSERIAERLSVGRAFLLGDAAHVMPPFGAQGLNTGSRDAVNLCWKLNLVLKGRAGVELLSSYEDERRQQIGQTVKYSVRVGRIANIRSRALAKLRNGIFSLINLHPGIRAYFSQMRYMPRPRITSGAVMPDARGEKGWVGTVFPLVRGLGPQRDRTFDQLAGESFALVGIDVPQRVLEEVVAERPWRTLDPVLLSLDMRQPSSSQANPAAERLKQIASIHRGEILIVRPDRYIGSAFAPSEATTRSHEFGALAHVLEPAGGTAASGGTG
jgi:3-(3-hydroxy-phenyl)propionate hydroxylase